MKKRYYLNNLVRLCFASLASFFVSEATAQADLDLCGTADEPITIIPYIR